MLNNRKIKIRWVKSYPSAHNHIAVGEIVESELQYLTVYCKTYHFGQLIEGAKGMIKPGVYSGGILEGSAQVRIIPWSRIEVIHVLDDDLEWNVPAGFDSTGTCVLLNENKTVIIHARDKSP